MKRIEPTDLVNQDWLGEDQYFAAENVSVDAGDLIIESTNAGPEEPSGDYVAIQYGQHFELSGGSNVTLGDCVIDAEEAGTVVVELWKYTQGTNNPADGTKVDDASISVAAGEQTITLNLTTAGDGDYWVGRISGPALLRIAEDQDYPWTSTDGNVEFVQGREFDGTDTNSAWYWFFDLQVDSLKFYSSNMSGWRVSNALNVGTVTDVTNSLVKWQATTPTDTDVDVSAAVTDNDWIGSLYFDGVDDTLEFTVATEKPKDPATFEAWVYLDQESHNQTTRFIAEASPDWFALSLSVRDDDKLTTHFRDDLNNSQTIKDTADFPLRTWVHVAITRENGSLVLYKDAESVATSDSQLYDSPAATAIHVGSDRDGARRWTGYVTDIRYWSTIRTQLELEDNRYAILEGDETGLVGYWQLLDGTGTTAEDSAGTNDGTITGATWTPGESGLFQDATNDAAIPGISTGDDLTGKYLWIRQDLRSTVADTPRLESLEYSISSETITRRRYNRIGGFRGARL